MRYIVLETQTYTGGSVGTIIESFEDRNAAESKYHTMLAAAAISQLPKHCAFMLDDSARLLKSEVYFHEVIPVPPEPEVEEGE